MGDSQSCIYLPSSYLRIKERNKGSVPEIKRHSAQRKGCEQNIY